MSNKTRVISWMMFLVIYLSIIPVNRVSAADAYTHDVNILRDSTITDPAFSGLMYNNNPYYIQIPRWNGYQQYSYTTPAVVGSELYQYTFDDSGYGHLWVIDLQEPASDWVPGNAVSAKVTLLQNFHAGTSGANNDVNSAAGVSGPTISSGYLAIAVGEYLYWWPIEHPEQIQSKSIQGNSNNYTKLIASSPLITPPLTANGTDINTLDPITWQTPFAIVGSWSGGVISQPLSVPDGVLTPNFGYTTTDDQSYGTKDIVTSSPSWNAHTTAVGTQGAAVFGVDAYASGVHRLILMDPTTGNFKSISQSGGSRIFRGGLSSSPAVASNGTIFVPDYWAGVYKLSANGDYLASDKTAMDTNNICITNVAFDGTNVVWVGNGHTTINTASATSFGSKRTKITGFYGLNSPMIVNNGASDLIFFTSTDLNGLYVTNPMTTNNLAISFQQAQDTRHASWQTLGAVSPPYSSAIADVGTDSSGTPLHYLSTWTNYGYQSQGCVEIWAPSSYGVTALVTPSIVDGGTMVQIQASPYPEDITAGITAHVTDGGGYSADLTLDPNTLTSPEKWFANTIAPENYTGASKTYTVTVTATSKTGSTATATTYFTVNPLPIPPGDLPGYLNIDAWRRNNTTYPPGKAKFGNRLVATLTVPTPPPPPGLANAVVTGARLTKAWVHHPNGEPNTTGHGAEKFFISSIDTDMTLNGLTATCQFTESWAGYPPHIPDDGTVMQTDTLYAPFSVHVDYKYKVYTETGSYWATGSYDAGGVAKATLDIIGSDWYTYPVSFIENHFGGE